MYTFLRKGMSEKNKQGNMHENFLHTKTMCTQWEKHGAKQVNIASTLLRVQMEVFFWDMHVATGGLAQWPFLYCAQTERPKKRTERSLPHAVLCSLGHGTTAVPAEIRVTHTISSFMFRVCGGHDSFPLLKEHSSWLKTHRGPPQEKGMLTHPTETAGEESHTVGRWIGFCILNVRPAFCIFFSFFVGYWDAWKSEKLLLGCVDTKMQNQKQAEHNTFIM